jgi:DNA-binding NarL/FixJ family response regulator
VDILIVDDSPNIRNNLKKFLSEIKGVIVLGEAESSEVAIELINKTKPEVIILDVELKNSCGFDVLKYVKKNKHSHKPVVIMFTNHLSGYKDKAKAERADYFFDKTTELDKLLTTIKSLI